MESSNRSASRTRPGSYLILGGGFALILFLSHAAFLGLPYHWDELGYFVPAALDLFRLGAWVPVNTLANIHPPGLSVYLSAIWTMAGYSIPATRAAMLVLASGAVLASFLLAIELSKGRAGYPAFAAAGLLLLSPLFFTQSMMAQLDMPAMLFCTLALLWFLQDRIGLSVAACTAAVLMKETALVAPLVFALWLARDRRWKAAAWFAIPALALCGWLVVLTRATGNTVGNAEFGWYNVVYPLHPVRLGGALLRRVSYLFLEEFRWVGTIALVWALRRGELASRAWRVAGSLAVAQTALVTVLGGAELERYLLPAMPVLYAAFVVSLRWKVALPLLAAGLFACNFWNPPLWPFPQENNLAMVDFVFVQQAVAQSLETSGEKGTVVTAWPLSDALRRPEFGYVSRPLHVRPLEDFSIESLSKIPADELRLVVIYSRDWDPPHNLLRIPLLEALREKYFLWHTPATEEVLKTRFGLSRIERWARGGQWIEIWRR
ncbi:MAG: hypothetical protein ABI693_06950 [Bryobacteraceae bacterium]